MVVGVILKSILGGGGEKDWTPTPWYSDPTPTPIPVAMFLDSVYGFACCDARPVNKFPPIEAKPPINPA